MADVDAIAQAKRALRARILAARDALAPPARAQASERITQQLLALDAFERAQVVMAYCSFGSELDTSSFIAAVHARGKTLVLPRVNDQRTALEVFVVRDAVAELVANAWGIREPHPERCMPAALPDIDFLLVPGLALDARGGRLGYGKGYYDALLHAFGNAGAQPFVIAGAFEAQMVSEVPTTARDVRVPRVITEARAIQLAS